MRIEEFLREKGISNIITKHLRTHYGFVISERDFMDIGKDLEKEENLRHSIQYYNNRFSLELMVRSVKKKYRINSKKIKTPLGGLMCDYLELAGACFINNIAIGGILLCRSALEAGLRSRIIEEGSKRSGYFRSRRKEGIIKQLARDAFTLNDVINQAGSLNIITSNDIKKIFVSKLKRFKKRNININGTTIFNKFVHNDIVAIKSILTKKLNIKLSRSPNTSLKIASTPGIVDSFIFIFLFEAVFEIAAIIYS